MSDPAVLSRRSFAAMGGLAIVCAATRNVRALSSAPVSEFTGHWAGVMMREDQALQVEFNFSRNSKAPLRPAYFCPMDRQVHSDHPGKCPICGMDLVRENQEMRATFTCWTQSTMDYPLEQLKLDGPSFEAALGDSVVLSGKISGDVLQGKFTDGGAYGTFELHRKSPAILPYSTRDVIFQNGDVNLAGTLCLPRTRGKHAGVVLLHGSGGQTRWGTNRYLADRFARAGIVALAYDKRGSGESTGAWETSTYEDLAGDALAGVDLLRSLPQLDAARIGLHGHSEGGIVAPVATNRAPAKIAFLIAEDTVAGPVYQQDLYRTHLALLHADFSTDQVAEADRFYSLFIDAARGVVPRVKLKEATHRVEKEPWFAWLALPGDESWIWARYPKLGNVDTLPLWAKIQVPVLLVYGERDQLVPVDESIARIQRALPNPDAHNVSRIVPNAQHNLTIQPDDKGPFFWWRTAQGVYALVIDWTRSTMQRS